MSHRSPPGTLVATLCLSAAVLSLTAAGDVPPPLATEAVVTVPGMPPVPDPNNLYSEAGAGKLSAAVAGALPRVYVPNVQSNDVYVIDQATMKVVDRFKVGVNPQHVVPSWDLKTLWVANNAENRADGSLTPIDPVTGKPGRPIVVDDPYNMYFTPDGRSAIVVAESRKRLDFRDPHSMQMQASLATPQCDGINHADFSIDGRFAIFTCEFDGGLVKIDMVERKVLGYLKLSKPAPPAIASNSRTGVERKPHTMAPSMPQDIRVSPDGKLFYVADMEADGVFVVDGAAFRQIDFIADGHRYAWPLPEPRWQKALRRQSRIEQDSRTAARQGQRVGHRLRHAQGRGHVARSRAAAARTWATSAPTASACGLPVATTTSSTRSTLHPAKSRK